MYTTMKPRKHKIQEMEFFNNVEIPPRIDKVNNIIELLTWLCTILGIAIALYSIQTLYIVIKHYYAINYIN